MADYILSLPHDLHPSTATLVHAFAEAMGKKLAAAQRKYGYTDGWRRDDWEPECIAALLEHVEKGDPRDVAAYCAFLWRHGWATSLAGKLRLDELRRAAEALAAPPAARGEGGS